NTGKRGVVLHEYRSFGKIHPELFRDIEIGPSNVWSSDDSPIPNRAGHSYGYGSNIAYIAMFTDCFSDGLKIFRFLSWGWKFGNRLPVAFVIKTGDKCLCTPGVDG